MPEATNAGKENIVPSSPKSQNGSYPDSPATNGSAKNIKRSTGKMAISRIHMLDGTTWDCPIDVSALPPSSFCLCSEETL